MPHAQSWTMAHGTASCTLHDASLGAREGSGGSQQFLLLCFLNAGLGVLRLRT